MTSSSQPSQASMLLYWHDSQHDDPNYQIHRRTLFLSVTLFSIILFFALITLYIHRSCLPRDSTILHTPSLPLTRCVNGGLDPVAIRSLPVVLCRKEAEEERECCICLGGFEEGEKMKVLPPCRHCYHCECVDRWLKTESSCPLCRISVRAESSSHETA